VIATRAIVLAAGAGTRMRAADPAAHLTPDQQRAADAGLKTMIPVNGRPFLDYLLSTLADAGVREAALVVGPEHEAVRHYYEVEAPPSRIGVSFVVQRQPLGTAHALLAAEAWTGGADFLSTNADNLYPPKAVAALVNLDEPGLTVFERADLVRSSNIPPERVRAFALVQVDAEGYLSAIVEKPAEDREAGELVSMNCWRFDSRIFAACRDVPRSPRGELELPEAVGLAIRRGVRFRAVRAHGPVLDLSRRADTADVAQRLAGVVPRP
jgi:glucose-1-phosphate thymidylyltransferase